VPILEDSERRDDGAEPLVDPDGPGLHDLHNALSASLIAQGLEVPAYVASLHDISLKVPWNTSTDLLQLFSWDLESLWQNANRTRCDPIVIEAIESLRCMMEMANKVAKCSCLEWSTGEYFLLNVLNIDIYTSIDKLSSMSASYAVSQRQKRLLLQTTMRGLINCILQPSGLTPHATPPSLLNAAG